MLVSLVVREKLAGRAIFSAWYRARAAFRASFGAFLRAFHEERCANALWFVRRVA